MTRYSRFVASLAIGLLALTGCAVAGGSLDEIDSDAQDLENDTFMSDERADAYGVREGSDEALAVLRTVNQASGDQLHSMGLVRPSIVGAARSILKHRAGPQGPTFETLSELDSVPWVGPIVFGRILRYVRRNDLVRPSVEVVRAPTVSDVTAEKPAPGQYRVHMIDVGTGLAILVQGNDFTMLFDGGSGDDKRGISRTGNGSRLLAYLYAALGPSGPSECVPDGDGWAKERDGSEIRIDHVFLSHAHDDHNSLLDDVMRCYSVGHVWDPGALNDTGSHADFIKGVASEPGVVYHTAAQPDADRTLTIAGQTITFLQDISWITFAAGDVQALGQGATFKLLHADGSQQNDMNENSIVARVQLGAISLLLMGDAESGPRLVPDSPVGDVEKYLLETWRSDLDADILQVGHHGSMTSSRTEFLQAVTPEISLVSAGPKLYSGVRLPDQSVIDKLGSIGSKVYRTDLNDNAQRCPEANEIGLDDDRPGGCDNYIVEIGGHR